MNAAAAPFFTLLPGGGRTEGVYSRDMGRGNSKGGGGAHVVRAELNGLGEALDGEVEARVRHLDCGAHAVVRVGQVRRA